MFVMHDLELRRRALDMVTAGVNDCEVGGSACRGRRSVFGAGRRSATSRAASSAGAVGSRRRVELSAADDAELLGLHLGDGQISPMPRSQRLRLSLDAKYPTVIAEAEALLGPGKKHKRAIEFEAWQGDLVRAAPWAFVRGVHPAPGSTPIASGSAGGRMSRRC
jgi:hypothetical protein